MKYIYIVYLVYPNEPPRLSAVFSTHVEAQKYADRSKDDKSHKAVVIEEHVFTSADDI